MGRFQSIGFASHPLSKSPYHSLHFRDNPKQLHLHFHKNLSEDSVSYLLKIRRVLFCTSFFYSETKSWSAFRKVEVLWTFLFFSVSRCICWRGIPSLALVFVVENRFVYFVLVRGNHYLKMSQALKHQVNIIIFEISHRGIASTDSNVDEQFFLE